IYHDALYLVAHSTPSKVDGFQDWRDEEERHRPYLASNLDASTPSDLGGWLETDYGQGGNLLAMTAHAQCTHASENSAETRAQGYAGEYDFSGRNAHQR